MWLDRPLTASQIVCEAWCWYINTIKHLHLSMAGVIFWAANVFFLMFFIFPIFWFACGLGNDLKNYPVFIRFLLMVECKFLMNQESIGFLGHLGLQDAPNW